MSEDLAARLVAWLAEDVAAAGRMAAMIERQNAGGWVSSSTPPVPGNSVTINTAWLPDRVLREVGAKRAILSRHKPLPGADGSLFCAWCSSDTGTVELDFPWPCPDVQDLAAIY
jgi:hypothetical protein